MGYPVYYDGEVKVSPPLREEHAATLMLLANRKDTEETRPFLEAITEVDGSDALPRYALFYVSEEGDSLLPEEGESRHGLGVNLRVLQQHFLLPLGYTLNGAIGWCAEDLEDRGCIYLKNGQIEVVLDRIVNDGPSWSPDHHADDRLISRLGQLMDSADNTGCTQDLTVVSAEHIAAIRLILDGLGAKHEERYDPPSSPSADPRVIIGALRPYADYFAAMAEAHRLANTTRTSHYVHEDLDPSLSPSFRVNQNPDGATYTAVPEDI